MLLYRFVEKCRANAFINDFTQAKEDPFIQKLDAQVQKYNTPEWRQRQMTLESYLERAERIAIEKINLLNQRLADDGRIDDLLKAAKDPEYQKQLLKEYDI